jgi:hypothetical protein
MNSHTVNTLYVTRTWTKTQTLTNTWCSVPSQGLTHIPLLTSYSFGFELDLKASLSVLSSSGFFNSASAVHPHGCTAFCWSTFGLLQVWDCSTVHILGLFFGGGTSAFLLVFYPSMWFVGREEVCVHRDHQSSRSLSYQQFKGLRVAPQSPTLDTVWHFHFSHSGEAVLLLHCGLSY